MEPRYRPYQTNPEERLLLAASPLASTVRFEQFLTDSGLPLDRLVSSRMCAVPIPQYIAREADSDRQFPDTVNPEIIWHPLFWLPKSLRSHITYRLPREEGQEEATVHTESDDEWAARVALTLATSGVYDISNGQWLDMLSVVGLDSEDEDVLDRVREWLEGAPDDDLDRIDLSEFTDLPGQPNWALRSTHQIFPLLDEASHALLANSTVEVIDLAVQNAESIDVLKEEFAEIVESFRLVVGEGIDIAIEGVDLLELTDDVIQTSREYDGTWADFTNGVVSYYKSALIAVRDTYWPAFEKLAEDSASDAETAREAITS